MQALSTRVQQLWQSKAKIWSLDFHILAHHAYLSLEIWHQSLRNTITDRNSIVRACSRLILVNILDYYATQRDREKRPVAMPCMLTFHSLFGIITFFLKVSTSSESCLSELEQLLLLIFPTEYTRWIHQLILSPIQWNLKPDRGVPIIRGEGGIPYNNNDDLVR